jgi:hypothetical protein
MVLGMLAASTQIKDTISMYQTREPDVPNARGRRFAILVPLPSQGLCYAFSMARIA